jgi:hypothetical protein
MADSPALPADRPRLEPRDASARWIVAFAISLVAAIGIVLAFAWLLYRGVMGESPVARGTDAAAWSHANRRVATLAGERRELAARQQDRLHRYAWSDAEPGIARIPIERALELAAERGLPEWGDGQPKRAIQMIHENALDQ